MQREPCNLNNPKNYQVLNDRKSPTHTDLGSMSPRPNAWTYQENQMYVLFLKENKKEFEDEQKRRFSKIYLQMSLNLRNKTPEQCRTHHQKSLKKYKKIEKIISNLLPDMKQKLEKLLQCELQLLKQTKQCDFWIGGNQVVLEIKLQQICEW